MDTGFLENRHSKEKTKRPYFSNFLPDFTVFFDFSLVLGGPRAQNRLQHALEHLSDPSTPYWLPWKSTFQGENKEADWPRGKAERKTINRERGGPLGPWAPNSLPTYRLSLCFLWDEPGRRLQQEEQLVSSIRDILAQVSACQDRIKT